ncbi:MAG: energy transducer TonB, partial [Betaproteobacteria bacterium]
TSYSRSAALTRAAHLALLLGLSCLTPMAGAQTPKAAPPKVQSAQVVCQNYREVIGAIVYPREALREGLEGEVLIEFTVAADGRVKDVAVARSSNRIFNRVAARAAESMSCQGQGQDIRVVLPVGFTLK